MSDVQPRDVLLRIGGRTLHVTGTLCAAGAGRGYVELPYTHTRADGGTAIATFSDRDNIIRTAAADKIRIEYPPSLSGLVDQFGFPYCGPLLEGSRVFNWTRSEEFNDAAWTKTNCTISANSSTAPDGTATADAVITNNGTFNATVGRPTGALTNNTQQSTTFYVRQAAKTWARVTTSDNAGQGKSSWVNLSTGAVGTKHADHTIEVTTFGNLFFRIRVMWPSGTGALTAEAFVAPANADNDVNTTGDGVATSIHVWGGGMERDTAFPSSYVKTVASGVTRAADSLTVPVNFGPQNLTVLARMARPVHADASGSLGAANPGICDLGNSSINHAWMYFDSAARNNFAAVESGGAVFVSAAVPAGATLSYTAQIDQDATGKLRVAADLGSGLSAFSSLTPNPIAAWQNQILLVGHTVNGATPLYGVLLDLIIARGLRTRAEMMAIK